MYFKIIRYQQKIKENTLTDIVYHYWHFTWKFAKFICSKVKLIAFWIRMMTVRSCTVVSVTNSSPHCTTNGSICTGSNTSRFSTLSLVSLQLPIVHVLFWIAYLSDNQKIPCHMCKAAQYSAKFLSLIKYSLFQEVHECKVEHCCSHCIIINEEYWKEWVTGSYVSVVLYRKTVN